MPKHIVVDGFNVIRRDSRLQAAEQADFYGTQEKFNQQLARYCAGTSHRVTVVYDGARGPNVFRSRRRQAGVEIVYSAQGESADEVIQDWVAKQAGSNDGLLVVTADRALKEYCRRFGVATVPPEALMKSARNKAAQPADAEAGFGKQEESGWTGHTRKKGNSRRMPKARRRPNGLW